MSIRAGGILTASLMLGWVLGTHAVAAQTPAGGTWTDPPARGAATTAPQPATASPTAPTRDPGSAPAEGRVGTVTEPSAAKREAEAPAPSVVRRTARRERLRHVEPERPKRVVAARQVRPATTTRPAAPRLVERRDRIRAEPRRVVARAFVPRSAAAPAYRYDLPYAPPYASLPVGRVAEPGFGERRPVFAEGDDRARRIAAAQAAGYLVVRARSVRYPDGRIVRSYQPYEDDDGLD